MLRKRVLKCLSDLPKSSFGEHKIREIISRDSGIKTFTTNPNESEYACVYANLAFYVTLQIPTLVIGLCFYPLFGNKVAGRLYQSTLHVVNYLFVGIRLSQYPTSKPHILLVNHTTMCDSYLGVTLDAPYRRYRTLVKREIMY